MKTLLKILAAVVLGVGLTTGLAAAGTGTIGDTGADSSNVVKFNDDVHTNIDATNDTNASVNTEQNAQSGNADAKKNTYAGDVQTGDATNEANTEADITSSNSSALKAADMGAGNVGDNNAEIHDTGADSKNEVKFENNYKLDVNSTNTTSVSVNNSQNANSGDATSSKNTNGGGASTGNASNKATTSLKISSQN